MAGTHRFGKSSMPSAREIDENGFLVVRDCPLTSFGIFEYGAGQIGLPGDPMRIVKVYRPESAVSEKEFLESLRNIPMIDDHAMLSGFQGDNESDAPEDKGVDGILTGDVEYVAPWTRGSLKIFSRKMQQLLLRGKKDLSLGYGCRYTEQPGVWNGQPYEVVQDQLRGNHIALVGEGRVRGARVLDGLCFDHMNFEINPSQKRDKPMKQKRQHRGRAADNSAVAELQKLLPLLSAAFGDFLKQEQAEPEHQEDSSVPPEVSGETGDQGAGGAAENVEAQAQSELNQGDESTSETPTEQENAEQPNVEAATGEAQSEGDLAGLVQQVEAVLAQIKQMTGQGANDAVEGLQESPVEGAQTVAVEVATGESNKTEDNSQCVETAGNGQDAALGRFYADLARKNRTYDRVSALVGAFDSRAMDANGVAVYGLKKFGLSASKGNEQAVLDAYLNGVEKGSKKSEQKPANVAMDAASKGATDAMDAYLKGEK